MIPLAEARRRAVLTEFAALGWLVPPERVVVGAPYGAPLNGIEAELIYQNLLQLTQSAGTVPGTGYSSQTGSVTGGANSGAGANILNPPTNR